MNSKQHILNAFRKEVIRSLSRVQIEMMNSCGGSGIEVEDEERIESEADRIEKIFLTALTEVEREIYKEIREKIYKVYDEKYSHLTRDYRAEDEFRDDICGTNGLLSQLEKEKHT